MAVKIKINHHILFIFSHLPLCSTVEGAVTAHDSCLSLLPVKVYVQVITQNMFHCCVSSFKTLISFLFVRLVTRSPEASDPSVYCVPVGLVRELHQSSTGKCSLQTYDTDYCINVFQSRSTVYCNSAVLCTMH